MLSATNQNHTHFYISQKEFTFYYSENLVIFFPVKKTQLVQDLGMLISVLFFFTARFRERTSVVKVTQWGTGQRQHWNLKFRKWT